MNENPYQAPESELDVEPSENFTQFYVVSITKFTILFFSTLGLYTIYWFYKNWNQYKYYSGRNILPVPRAIFNIFFTYSLFVEIQNTLKKHNTSFNWSPGLLASAYIVFTIVSQMLDRLSMKDIGSPYTDVLSLLMLPLIYFTLLKPQKAINLSQNDPEGNSNNTFSVGNYAWIVFGVIFWALILLGLVTMLGFINVE